MQSQDVTCRIPRLLTQNKENGIAHSLPNQPTSSIPDETMY